MKNADAANNENQEHWLVRTGTIRKFWIGFALLLAATVVAQFLIPVQGYFGIDGWFGFGAVYGFFACVAMVVVARLFGVLIKRDERYYDD